MISLQVYSLGYEANTKPNVEILKGWFQYLASRNIYELYYVCGSKEESKTGTAYAIH